MTLAELLPKLSGFDTVVVTGAQRSGTAIATTILAAELKKRCVREDSFSVDNIIHFCLQVKVGGVIQAPGLSSVVNLIKDSSVAVVYMLRSQREIKQSIQRVNWIYDETERQKYFEKDKGVSINKMKLKAWQWQKQELGERAFELDYRSLEGHRLWVPKEQRINFNCKQTA